MLQNHTYNCTFETVGNSNCNNFGADSTHQHLSGDVSIFRFPKRRIAGICRELQL